MYQHMARDNKYYYDYHARQAAATNILCYHPDIQNPSTDNFVDY